jgi:thiol-disulfide isomerase/thioredoxin
MLLNGARGKTVLLNFWATWCPPCVNELPELARFVGESQDKALVFYSVSVDHPDTIPDRVAPFLRDKKWPYPVSVLGNQSPADVRKALGIEWSGAVPSTFVFDASGALKARADDEVNHDWLVKNVTPLLAGS